LPFAAAAAIFACYIGGGGAESRRAQGPPSQPENAEKR